MNKISISVCYAEEEKQKCIELELPKGITISGAIQRSGILKEFPQIDLQNMQTGVYSKPYPATHMLEDGDRVEIYRPALGKKRSLKKKG